MVPFLKRKHSSTLIHASQVLVALQMLVADRFSDISSATQSFGVQKEFKNARPSSSKKSTKYIFGSVLAQ